METKINGKDQPTKQEKKKNASVKDKEKMRKLIIKLSTATGVTVGAVGAAILRPVPEEEWDIIVPRPRADHEEDHDVTEGEKDQQEGEEVVVQTEKEDAKASESNDTKGEKVESKETKNEEETTKPETETPKPDELADEIDPNDIDIDSFFTNVVEFRPYYTETGEQTLAAVVEPHKGQHILLVDDDNDGIYDTAYTEDGSLAYITIEDTNIFITPEDLRELVALNQYTQSDMEDFYYNNGEYIAQNEADQSLVGSDIEGEIIATDIPGQGSIHNDEILALFSQLRDSNETTVNSDEDNISPSSDDEEVDIDALMAELEDDDEDDDEEEDNGDDAADSDNDDQGLALI